jgi:hypothetical protein
MADFSSTWVMTLDFVLLENESLCPDPDLGPFRWVVISGCDKPPPRSGLNEPCPDLQKAHIWSGAVAPME